MTRRIAALWALAGLVSLGVVPGCRAVLDIEEARLDPIDDDTAETVAGPDASDGFLTADGLDAGRLQTSAADTGARDAGSNASLNAGGSGNSEQLDSGSGGGDDTDDAVNKPPANAGDGGPTENPPGVSLCLNYCLTIEDHCSGEYEQYEDLSVCLGVCELLTPGEEGDEQINTVQCRLRQAELARLEPFTHCKYAGPIAQGECGSNCEAFCDLMMQTCTPETADEAYYADRDACMADCATLSDLGTYSSSEEIGHFAGDHVQCRAFHVCSAIEEADYHCAHSLGDFPCK